MNGLGLARALAYKPQQWSQDISVSAVDWQQHPTARISDQSNCLPLAVLACSPCHGHRSLAVHSLVARSTSTSPSPSLLPGRRARAVATAIARAVATAACEVACRRRRAQPASSLASASSPSPPQACHHSHRRRSGLFAITCNNQGLESTWQWERMAISQGATCNDDKHS